jgi:hypothetical protein
LKKNHKIDLDEECQDVNHLKSKIFGSSLYQSAKENLNYQTMNKYRRFLNSCGNNKKRLFVNSILSLGKTLMKKKEDNIDPNLDDNKIIV